MNAFEADLLDLLVEAGDAHDALPQSARSVLLALVSRASRAGSLEFEASFAAVSRDCGLSGPTAVGAARDLEQLGGLTIENRGTKGAHRWRFSPAAMRRRIREQSGAVSVTLFNAYVIDMFAALNREERAQVEAILEALAASGNEDRVAESDVQIDAVDLLTDLDAAAVAWALRSLERRGMDPWPEAIREHVLAMEAEASEQSG